MLLPYLNKDLIEAGCDEAGRGCLAGSVYAAAVILPVDFKNELLNDSKQLTEHQRYVPVSYTHLSCGFAMIRIVTFGFWVGNIGRSMISLTLVLTSVCICLLYTSSLYE